MGILLGLGIPAGCTSNPLGRPTSSRKTATTSTEPTGTETVDTATSTSGPKEGVVGEALSINGEPVTVVNARVQRFVRERMAGGPEHRVRSEADRIYVTSTLELTGEPINISEFLLDIDGNRYRESLIPVIPENQSGDRRLAFTLPVPQNAAVAAIVATDDTGDAVGRWRFSESTLFRLNNPPVLELVSIDIPDRLDVREDFPVTITVRNTGPTDGMFMYNLKLNDMTHVPAGTLHVPAKQKATREETVRVPPGSGSVTVHFNYGRDVVTKTVNFA